MKKGDKVFIEFYDIDRDCKLYVDPSLIYLIEETTLRNKQGDEMGNRVCRKLYLNTPNNLRNFIFVEDTVDEVMKLLTSYEKNLRKPGGVREGLVKETKKKS